MVVAEWPNTCPKARRIRIVTQVSDVDSLSVSWDLYRCHQDPENLRVGLPSRPHVFDCVGCSAYLTGWDA